MNWNLVIAILALIVAGVSLLLTLDLARRLKRNSMQLRKAIRNIAPQATVHFTEKDAQNTGPAYVIYNPTKDADWVTLRKYLLDAATSASLPEPIWLETTESDPGPGQARKALAANASVVIVAGGDGTVRAVAEEIAGTGTPLGLLPVGTGNLFARNLDLPLQSAKDLASIALTGSIKPVDVAWLEISETPAAQDVAQAREAQIELAKPGKYAFLVIGGMGFDAVVMDSTSAKLKDKVGWLAYVSAGMKNLFSEKMKVQICPGDSGRKITTEARSVMFMNCGELTGGIVLEPNADPTDSWLELTVLDIKGGVLGWIDLARKVMAKNMGLRERSLIPINSVVGDLDTRRVRNCTVQADSLQAVQIDGDVLGYAKELAVSLSPGALNVRVRKS